MLFAILLGMALIPCVIYAVVAMLEVPGMADERLGVLEDLPSDVGEWVADTDSAQARAAAEKGLACETRLWIDPEGDFFKREKILRQVRYLDPESGDVVRSEPDVRVKRRRIKTS